MGQIITTYAAYEIAGAFAAPAGSATILQMMKTGAPTPARSMGLTRLTITLASAVDTQVALAYAATDGTSSAGSVGERISTGNGGLGGPGSGRMNTAWSVAPTYAGTPLYMRAEQMPGVFGARLEWTWPENDPLLLSSPNFPASLLLRNLSGIAGASMFVSARWLEFIPSL